MRNKHSGSSLSIRAIAGTHVVALAWDLKPVTFDTAHLLGFAVERTKFDSLARTTVVERYFLRGIKRFQDKDKGLPAGTPVPTSEHPIQSFLWGDYTVEASTAYTYRLVPTTGTPMALTLRNDLAISVDIDTEPLYGTVHSIFFNRGAAGSQAYARDFTDPTPKTSDPASPQNVWLSRGLYEALIEFIGRAKDSTFGLRAALYEFHYDPVGAAFKAALGRNADVKILYDEPNFGDLNRKMINHVGLSRVCAPRKSGGAQKHNKFIVLLKNGNPIEVWTGSTNISDGGILGHSNVGHLVRSPQVAAQYLAYWEALCNPITPPPAGGKPFSETRTDPAPSGLIARNNTESPTPGGNPPNGSITALFSPRDGATLQWYADRMAAAHQVVCFMVAFTLAANFEPFLEADSNVLRFVLSDKQLTQGPLITKDRDVVYAAGAKFEKGELPNFLAEKLTGLNTHVPYIHDKFMLIDPLGDDPTTITGSANFSPSSQTKNDENMLAIRSDQRVADVYFTEFMRLFDHLYARYLAKKIKEEQKKAKPKGAKGSGGYLRPDPSWVADHFGDTQKSRRRQYFHGAWEA